MLTASGPIAFAQFGTDGSALVRVERTLERYAGDAPPVSVRLPGFWTGAEPIVSPDTCLAAVLLDHGIFVFSLCGSEQRLEASSPGSPTATRRRGLRTGSGSRSPRRKGSGSSFTGSCGPDQALRWPADAAQLAWSVSD